MTWPIHSALMEPVARAVAPLIQGLESVRDPSVPFYAPDGSVVLAGEQVRTLLGSEFVHPTLWNATFEAMVAAGHRAFLEVGPGEMLGRMSRWIDRSVAVHRAGTPAEIARLADILRS